MKVSQGIVLLLSALPSFTVTASSSALAFHFNHVGISVANLTLQRDWYNRTLGFSSPIEVVGPMEMPPAPTSSNTPASVSKPSTIQTIQLQNPTTGAIVELIWLSSSTPASRQNSSSAAAAAIQGLFHFAYRVPDLNGTIAKLKEDGVHIVQPIAQGAPYINHDQSTFAYISDPEGNLIELIQVEH
ncbi:Glyoxalase/Bleomycin resistance protein/Dihydroxybiphenyl dioxygenase [Trichoderma sp. SZMC 28014]